MFYKSLREHKIKIINSKKKKNAINKQTIEIIQKCKKLLYFLTKRLKIKTLNMKNIKKLGTIVIIGKYRDSAHTMSNLNFSLPKQVPIVSQWI